MLKEDLYNSIEKYLEGSLDADALARFEDRLASEPELLEEVNLHRKLQEGLENPVKRKLRMNLDQLRTEFTIEEVPISAKKKKTWSFIIPIVTAVILCGLLLWVFVFRTTSIPSTIEESKSGLPEVSKEIESQPQLGADTIVKKEILPTKEEEKKVQKSKDPVQISKTQDLANDIPNQIFESLIQQNGTIKTFEIGLEEPAPEEKYMLVDTYIEFQITGTLETSASKIDNGLSLTIFDNRSSSTEVDKARNSFVLPLTKEEEEESSGFAFASKELYNFEITKRIELNPGLYYYVLRMDGQADILHTASFTVDKN